MFNINEAVKHDFKDLSPEDRQYIEKTFLRYIVRREVADSYRILSSIFSNGRPDARVIAGHFQTVNSSFVNCNLISQITYQEATTDVLKDKSPESFNYRLSTTYNLKDGAAVILFSRRPNENIPNRVNYETLIAYADMQARIIDNLRSRSFRSTFDAIVDAAKTTRHEFYQKYGRKIEDTHVTEQCQLFSHPGKKTATLWIKMLDYYQEQFNAMDPGLALTKIQSMFTPTMTMKEKLSSQLDVVEEKTRREVQEYRSFVEKKFKAKPGQNINMFDDYANIADYDEAYSAQYELGVYKDNLEDVIKHVFEDYKAHLSQYALTKPSTKSTLVDSIKEQKGRESK